MDDRNVIIEIRAGTGGDEASLFAGDLFRMYERFAAKQGWKVEVVSASEGAMGGYKEIIAEIRGRGAFAKLKFESGVHRVQRVPDTEASGRIHTSAATVAVLPEAEEVDIVINEDDLRIDTLRASGAGGQHVNKTESAIRVFHIPTGIEVKMQEDRSQHRNRAKAMAVLRARLYDHERQKLDSARAAERRGQVGSGDRSERIRTYNFPQGRVSDHRINLTLYKLPQIIEGEALGEIIDALVTEHQAELLAAEGVVMATRRGRHRASSIRRRAAASGAGVPRRRPRHARPRRAHPGRPCARARPCSARGAGGSPPHRPRKPTRSPRSRSAASTASRSRGSSARKEFWGLPLALNADTLVPRPETETVVEAALAALGDGARPRAAHRRSRHRLRRAAAGAASRTAGGARRRHRHQRRRARTARARMPPRSALPRRASFVACDHGAALARRRSIWSLPTRPMWRAATSRACSRRCATSIRAARSTAARMDSRPIARSPAMRGGSWRRMACWCSNSAPGSLTPSLVNRRRGLAPADSCEATSPASRAPSPSRFRHRSFGSSKWAEPACRPHSSATQKSTWIVGSRPTRFRAGIDPRRQQEPAATLRRATGAKARDDLKPEIRQ